MMEQARDMVMASPGVKLGSRYRFELLGVFAQVYSDKFLDEAAGLLLRARAKVEGKNTIYLKRVDFVQSGLDYVRLMMRCVPVMKKVRESKGKDAESVREAVKIWDEIEKLCRQSEPFALNWGNTIGLMTGKGYQGGMQDYFGPPSDVFRKAAGLPEKETNKGKK
jgi:hypothetical protein